MDTNQETKPVEEKASKAKKKRLIDFPSITLKSGYMRAAPNAPIVRVHPETGQRVPRVRMSKKERLRLRKELSKTLEVN